jgi:pyruvate dehydrogenase E1 component alpha subunit
VAVCFFGDGATNIGAFHEALNFASIWKLPVVFVCENNLYMEYTPIRSVTAVAQPAADRAASYGLERIVIDGNDVEAVYATATRLLAQAREGRGPSLVEALTYRHGGHSRADPGQYRPDDEVTQWLAKDPIPRFRALLLADGAAEKDVKEIEDEVAVAVDEATEEARNSPLPDEKTAMTEVWSDGGSEWRN